MANHPTLKLALSFFGKLIVCKIFAGLLNVVLLVALGGNVGVVVTQILGFAILVAIMYSTSWQKGFSQINMPGFKRDKFRGLKAGLIASILEFAAAILLIVIKIKNLPNVFISVVGIFNTPFLPFHLTILPSTLTVNELSIWLFIASASTVLVMPIIVSFGYYMGISEISIADTLIYTTPEARAKRKERAHKRREKGNGLFR